MIYIYFIRFALDLISVFPDHPRVSHPHVLSAELFVIECFSALTFTFSLSFVLARADRMVTKLPLQHV